MVLGGVLVPDPSTMAEIKVRRCSLRLQNKKLHLTPAYPELRKFPTRRGYGCIDTQIQSCKYKYRGCKQQLPEDELKTHQSQCKFRWYICEGRKFAGWECNWKGYYEDISNHFREVHSERTYMKVQNIIDMNIIFTRNSYDIELIKRRNQLFWFKHRLLTKEKTAYWLCQYVGPQDDAVTYCYDLVISDEERKFAVTELCYTDALDADEIYETGKCVVMTFDQIKNFTTDGRNVHLYFRIKKNVKRKR